MLDPGPGEGVPGLAANPHADALPETQFEHDEFLPTDSAGNPLAPQYHRVLLLSLADAPSNEAARTVERSLRTLEAAYEWASDGLLHMLAWGTDYFERIDALERAPIEHPEVLSRTDDPDLLSFDAALVLESDTPSRSPNSAFSTAVRCDGV